MEAVLRIVGRKQEQAELDRLCASPRPEFLVVYGRRRVGKTFLIREYFNRSFAFYATGVANGSYRVQLRSFSSILRDYGDANPQVPHDWFEAFDRLKALLLRHDAPRDAASGKLVVFIDELPWLDTPRSQFKQALDLFWNGFGSARSDLLFIVCGSATSWVIRNLLRDHGGLHNRITSRLHLKPFTLAECEAYYQLNDFAFTRLQMAECYMALGGIPFYLDLLDRRLSLAQNIDRLCFSETGALRYEFEELYRSLFKNAGLHLAIIRFLATRRGGFTRQDIEQHIRRGSGGSLTRALDELEECGFIRRYQNPGKRIRGSLYQLMDPFTLFYLRFIDGQSSCAAGSWLALQGSPTYHTWTGIAFETVGLLHVDQIKGALGVSGIASKAYAWRSTSTDPGAQIDLVIDRADNVINLCEIKYRDIPFEITKAYEQALRQKVAAYAEEVAPRKALHLTLIAPYGVANNAHKHVVQNVITLDDFFRDQ